MSTTNDGATYKRFIKKQQSSIYNCNIEEFAHSILVNIQKNSDHTLEMLLNNKEYFFVDFLVQIINQPFTLSSSSKSCSFSNSVVPLLAFFCWPSVSEGGNQLLSFWHAHFSIFKEKIVPSLEEIVQQKKISVPTSEFSALEIQSLHTAMTGDKRYNPDNFQKKNSIYFQPMSFTEIFVPIVDLLWILLTRFSSLIVFGDEVVENISKIFIFWKKEFSSFDTPDTDYSLSIVSKKINRLVQLLDSKKVEMRTMETNENRRGGFFIPQMSFKQPGGRFDNDKLDFSEIRIIPTVEEILYDGEIFLPTTSRFISTSPHFLPNGAAKLLDNQFRLLREDMIRPIRTGIQLFLKSIEVRGELETIGNGRFGNDCFGDDVDLNIYQKVSLAEKKAGNDWVFKFKQPFGGRMVEISWEKGIRLSFGSFVAIIVFKSNDLKEREFFLGTVSNRDVKLLAKSSPLTSISLCESTNEFPRIFDHAIMIEASKVLLPAYTNPLKALQQIKQKNSLPFVEYLTEKGPFVVKPAVYTSAPNFQFKLDPIMKTRDSNARLNVSDDLSKAESIQKLREGSILDSTQSEAFVNSVSKELSLIQGPPGTGKSWIGVAILKVLLASNAPGPILILAYTNHALDQMLMHLVKEGIFEMVRLGTRSKEKMLEPFSLKEISKASATPSSRYSYRIANENSKAAKEKVTTIGSILTKARLSIDDRDCVEFVNFYYKGLFDSIKNGVLSMFEDDFQEVKKKKQKKKITQNEKIYRYWVDGKDIDFKIAKALDSMDGDWVKEEGNLDFGSFEDVADLNLNRDSFFEDDFVEEELFPEDKPIFTYEETFSDRDFVDLIEDRYNSHFFSRVERVKFDNHVREIFKDFLEDDLREQEDKYQIAEKQKTAINAETDRKVIKSKRIIGATTTGAAKSQSLLEAVAPGILMAEEAGEILEANLLACLGPSIQQMFLIGDHMQLRPKVAVHNLSTSSKEGEKYELDLSLFERLQIAKFPSETLFTQRRMKPLISSMIRNSLYPYLEDGDNTLIYPDVKGIAKNLFFVDHCEKESSKLDKVLASGSHSNRYEADMAVSLLKYLTQQGYSPSDLVILTPYVGQLLLIRKILADQFVVVLTEKDEELLRELEELTDEDKNPESEVVASRTNLKEVRIATIDSFQGEEAKFVIISLVRTGKTIGFLKIFNRINVLLSRAQHGMALFGNKDLLRESGVKMWGEVVDYLETNDLIFAGVPLSCSRHPRKGSV